MGSIWSTVVITGMLAATLAAQAGIPVDGATRPWTLRGRAVDEIGTDGEEETGVSIEAGRTKELFLPRQPATFVVHHETGIVLVQQELDPETGKRRVEIKVPEDR